MTYFRTVKAALDALIAGVCAHRNIPRQEALRMAGAVLGNMSQEWHNGTRPTIAYGDPLCRFAYLYCHTSVNANICDSFIRADADTLNFIIERLNQLEELKVCAFGGGPGTELLALAKLLKQAHGLGRLQGHGEVNFTILDNTSEWAESWNALDGAIRTDFGATYGPRRDWPFTISRTFQPFDMTNVAQFANLAQLLAQDVYILNYVVSEILTNEAGLGNVLNLMAHHAPQGARFLIVDRNQDGVLERSQALLANAGLHEVFSRETSTNMDREEQATHLEDYFTDIPWRPRVQWKGAFCIVAVKP